MCTCLDIKGINHYFGRSLDLDYHYNEECVITPRGYKLSLASGDIHTKYAIIGTAMVVDSMPFYYEAVNERGLCIAGLNFPYNATFNKPNASKLNLAISDIIPYFLSKYERVSELRIELARVNITDEARMGMPLASLHFMISDGSDTIVVEQGRSGLRVYENPYGVMTNNPPFELQIKNLSKYEKATNSYIEADDLSYTCVGNGTNGLPGGFSSPDRFVKAAFLRKNASLNGSEYENAYEYFHMMDSIAMIDNMVLNKLNKPEISYYISCINATRGLYYYKTYTNNEIKCISLNEGNINSEVLTRFPLDYEYSIKKLN